MHLHWCAWIDPYYSKGIFSEELTFHVGYFGISFLLFSVGYKRPIVLSYISFYSLESHLLEYGLN